MEVGLNWRLSTPMLRSIRSHFRHHEHCSGGNLIRIDTDQCEVSPTGRRQCKVKCNGLSTRDPRASKWMPERVNKIFRLRNLQFMNKWFMTLKKKKFEKKTEQYGKNGNTIIIKKTKGTQNRKKVVSNTSMHKGMLQLFGPFLKIIKTKSDLKSSNFAF